MRIFFLILFVQTLTTTGCTQPRTLSEWKYAHDLGLAGNYRPQSDGTIERDYYKLLLFLESGHPSLGGPTWSEHSELHRFTVTTDEKGNVISWKREVVNWDVGH